MYVHPRPALEAFWEWDGFSDDLQSEGIIEQLPEIDKENKRKVLGENYADLHGFDLDELKKNIEGDEFDDGQSLTEPYSTTPIEAVD